MLHFSKDEFSEYLKENELDQDTMSAFELTCALGDFLSFQSVITSDDVDSEGKVWTESMIGENPY